MRALDMLEHILDLIPAYVLGALETAEVQMADRHLEQCPACQAELNAYRQVVADLALASPQHNPPARLKEHLMKQVHQSVAQTSPGWMQQIWQRMRTLSPVWAISSLVLILVLAASNLFWWQQTHQLQSKLRSVSLNNTAAAPNAAGLLVLSVDGESGTLVVDGLPALGEKQQYQLWLIDKGKRTSGGVFSVSQEGYGSLWIESPKPLISYQSFGITIEPFGGSPGPTGEKVLGGQF